MNMNPLLTRRRATGKRVDLEASASPRRVDAITSFGNHEALLADLREALAPGRPPSVLAVFDLAGASDYRRKFGERACETLIASCAQRFGRAIQPGACYRPRQDEFCALISQPIDTAMATLVEAEHAIRGAAGRSVIVPCFAVAVLPDEADDPTELLMLADQRLFQRLASRPPRREV